MIDPDRYPLLYQRMHLRAAQRRARRIILIAALLVAQVAVIIAVARANPHGDAGLFVAQVVK